jgi:hypothetical protein
VVKGPTRLSAATTFERILAAIGPMRDGLAGGRIHTRSGSRENLSDAVSRLERIRQIADPDAAVLIPLIRSYVEAYAAWAAAFAKKGAQKGDYQPLQDELLTRRTAVRDGIERLVADRAFIDKMLHP